LELEGQPFKFFKYTVLVVGRCYILSIIHGVTAMVLLSIIYEMAISGAAVMTPAVDFYVRLISELSALPPAFKHDVMPSTVLLAILDAIFKPN
jgi:hypothetical protein